MEITVDTAKEVLGYLGIDLEKVKDIPEFKTKFDIEFTKSSNITEESEPVKKILGKTYGTLENEVKKIAKDLNITVDFESPDYKDLKKLNDKFKFVATKLNEQKELLITEAKTAAGKEVPEQIKEWEVKLEKEKAKTKEKDTLLKSVKDEFEAFKGTHETFKVESEKKIKDTKLNIVKKSIFDSAKYIPDINPFTKKGFISEFEAEFIIDLDDEEKPIITDRKGNKIPSVKKSGEFKTPNELLEEKLIEAKLSPLNPKAGEKKPTIPERKTPDDNTKKTGRTLGAKLQ